VGVGWGAVVMRELGWGCCVLWNVGCTYLCVIGLLFNSLAWVGWRRVAFCAANSGSALFGVWS
jgi:hypothetical protein